MGCAPTTAAEPTASASAPLDAPAPVVPNESAPQVDPAAPRDVAVLVVESRPGALSVLSAQRVAPSELGAGRTFNGRGAATYRWTLRGAGGEELASGPIAARRDLHVAEHRGESAPAAHADRARSAFVVRAPYPRDKEYLEIATVDGASLVGWRP